MKNLAWHTKLALAFLIIVPLWFVIGALGTKIGLWSWQIGLGFFAFQAGIYVLGLAALVALLSLILAAIKKPRSRVALGIAIAGLLLPAIIFAQFVTTRSVAGDNPIHDVSTDTADPPQLSPETRRMRLQAEANPLNDYQTPLREIEMFASLPNEVKIKSHAQIINETYAELAPLPLGGATRDDAVAAVAAAMGQMGFADIRTDAEAGRVEGVAETFWYGFKDDVVARIGEAEIDFRSVSRVGRSDLGANAERIAELRERVAAQIGQR
ncbi:DUF1499 domain-containing protein [Qipengyuania nanhaisediminis]|uniref:DUF1499 domain-containing protein n=1 Tax=Qipengyuania nanhaisediminis TaxID=604088 RepID=UPI0038B3219B